MAKYVWPASGLQEMDMALLYSVRESLPTKVPITKLILHAVRETYGHVADTQASVNK